MKTFLKTIILFLLFGYVEAQERNITFQNLVSDTSGYIDYPVTQSFNLTPAIKGEVDVSSFGSLTFNIPIEVFKGVNEFQPNISIAYNSQTNGGTLGFGWNITGLSSITIGGKSKKTDGAYENLKFDGNDPFYLDGQRLLKVTDTDFVTESLSKIKIKKTGNSFTVSFTDGKVSKYELKTLGQYLITSFKDAFGNEIKYNYFINNNVAYINTITYGGTTPPFKIQFNRKTRTFPNKIYRNGTELIENYLINEILISSTSDGVYRKYTFDHDISSSKNERLRKIIVKNKNEDELKPMIFNYNGEGAIQVVKEEKSATKIDNNARSLGNVVYGDFEGNGKVTSAYITRSAIKVENNQSNYTLKLNHSKLGTLSTSNEVSFSNKLSVGRIIDANGKLSYNDRVIELKAKTNSPNNIASYNNGFVRNVTFNISATDIITAKKLNAEVTFPFGYFYDDLIRCGNYDDKRCMEIWLNDGLNIIEGDFNNDGLVDLVVLTESGNLSKNNNNPAGFYDNIGNMDHTYYLLEDKLPPRTYFIEIGKNIKNGGVITPQLISENTFFKIDDISLFDYDGDGISELMYVNKDTKTFKIYKISENSIYSVYSGTLNNYDKDTPIIVGDFNGDGLMDFMTPLKIYDINKMGYEDIAKGFANDKKEWWQYINKGNGFVVTKRDFTSQNLAYCKPSQKNVIDKSTGWEKFWSGKLDEYSHTNYLYCGIIPIDYNSDGRTDLISFNKFGKAKPFNKNDPNPPLSNSQIENIFPNNGLGKTNKLFLIENVPDNSSNKFSLNLNSQNTIDLKDIKLSPYTIILNNSDVDAVEVFNSGIQFYDALLGKEINIDIKVSSFLENQLIEVDNNSGVKQVIEYTPLAEYFPDKKHYINVNLYYKVDQNIFEYTYPYNLNKQQPNFYLVKRISTVFDDKSISKEYRYKNAMQHLDGLGFIGFQKTYISDPYLSKKLENEYLPTSIGTSDVFWTVNTYDANFEGQLIKTSYGDINEKHSLSTSNQFYDRHEKANKQYVISKKYTENHDLLKDVKNSTYYTYNTDHTLITSIYNSYNDDEDGHTIDTFQYESEFSNGDKFFFGKIKKIEKINVVENSNSTETFSTKEEFTYNQLNGSVIQNKKYGNGTDPLITTYQYYNEGNVKEESLTGNGIPVGLTTKYEYDTTKRFTTKVTSPEGKSELIEVDIYGKILKQTSYLGLSETYKYDNWGNNIERKDQYGIVTTLIKNALSNGDYQLYTNTQGLPNTIQTFDKFDRVKEIKTQSIKNKWLVQRIEYDDFGKKIKESEPFFEGQSPSLWNEYIYDELDRVIEQRMYTGQNITTCFEGNSITVDDGQRRTYKKFDAFGNTRVHKDKGGQITYNYHANGELLSANYDGVIITTKIDGWGNKIELKDPSAGTYTYKYNVLGNILEEKSPKGKTVYTYDNFGYLINENTTSDDNTSINSNYSYNPNTKLIESMSSVSNGLTFSYETHYDDLFRIKSKVENHPHFKYTSSIDYDSINRVEYISTNTTILEINKSTTTKIQNIYDSNGILVEQRDALNNRSIKKIEDLNARGQTTSMSYGNNFKITNTYNEWFIPTSIKDHNNSTNQTALHIDYNFDKDRKILHSRNIHQFATNESFEYDALDRLIREKVNGQVSQEYVYDERGRMVHNAEVGKYNYQNNNYKLASIEFNQSGTNKVINDRGFHQLKFNSYKQATEIYLAGKDRISFDFNPFKSRSISYFGSESTDKNARPYRKYYSSDNAIEIIKKDGNYTVTTYVDGDPYTSSYIKIDNFYSSGLGGSTNYFLHRDYQGSILAISNTAGRVVEKRYFDAWGNVKQVIHTKWNGSTATHTYNTTLGIIDRGYTGHEHLQSVGLIHMNGRLYDPIIRRFISPDNFVQDPYNTQNYDRYGYVYNNPLLFVDPSGEEFFTAVIIGAAIAIGINAIMNIINGLPVWYGMGKSAVMGAVSGAVSFGIGVAASSITSAVAKASFQVVAHGLSSSMMAGIDGADIGAAFLAGAVSSLLSSAVQGLANSGYYIDDDYQIFSSFASRNPALTDAITIAAGGLSGGLSSSIAGGNFWAGMRQGLITSGLNHVGGKIGFKKVYDISTNDMSYTGEIFQNDDDLKNYINEKIGNFDLIEKDMKTTIRVATPDNIPSKYKIIDNQLIKPDGGNSGGITIRSGMSKNSKILISPNTKGLCYNVIEGAKMVIVHEILHAYHIASGLKDFDRYTEYATSTYTYAFLKHHSVSSRILNFYKPYLKPVPASYSWKNLPSYIKKW